MDDRALNFSRKRTNLWNRIYEALILIDPLGNGQTEVRHTTVYLRVAENFCHSVITEVMDKRLRSENISDSLTELLIRAFYPSQVVRNEDLVAKIKLVIVQLEKPGEIISHF
jgi:hypothetical protein